MDTIDSKIAYLKGLVEGLEINEKSKEGKILAKVMEVLQDMQQEINDLKHNQYDIESYLNIENEDLSFLEDEFNDEDDEDEDIGDFIDMVCPKCQETLYVDTKILQDRDSIICPNCHKDIPLDLSNDCDNKK